MKSVRFTVNGGMVEAEATPGLTLLHFLRDVSCLKGTKNGCSTGHCGACTILLDGRAARSCRLNVASLEGRRVETIEGLEKDGALHPLQTAFLAAGAVQCGFCTPGMLMAAKGLLDRIPRPTEAEIRRAFRGNICRCTGYLKIVEAVRMASEWTGEGRPAPKPEPTRLGRSAPDYDGLGKVRGRLRFADDLELEGMLHGALVWSAHPHAEITGVDTRAALALPGIRSVLTARDIPGHNGMGSLVADQPVLCSDRVRFLGDVVAVIVADSELAARAAAEAVTVAYRELPGVFSPDEALQPNAIMLHQTGNTCKHLLHEVGDVREALSGAAIVLEGHFETPFVEHAYLEPEAALAYVDEDGILTLKAPTQGPFEMRRQLAAVLKCDEERVRVICTPLGGGFGGKLDNTIEAVTALCAYVLRRPVKIRLTREESLRVSTKRHAYSLDYQVGFSEDGELLGVDARLLSDAGPYTALSPRVIDQACLFACGPYRVADVRLEGWAVHTNNANGSAFRGFGINQAAVAIESIMDEAARRLGLSPFEIRRRNALRAGDATVSGEVLRTSVTTQATIDAAEQALAARLPELEEARSAGRRIGIGVASGFKNVGAGKGKVDDAGAIFILKADGSILLKASAVDMGQGIRTALLQIAGQALECDAGGIEIVTGDTKLTMRHGGAVGERQILISGKAVELAAIIFRAALINKAASVRSVPASDLTLRDRVVWSDGGPLITLEELAEVLAGQGETIEVSHYHVAPKTYSLADAEARATVPVEEYRNYPAYAYATQVAIVEVDEASGVVKVLEIIAAHDCGTIVNRQKIEGQIEGSCAQGLGYALSEDYPVRQGVPTVRSFGGLKVPTAADMPSIHCVLIEDPEPSGPYGAKGISEVATVPVTPAILNAIYDAVGVRVQRLPARPDVIKQALQRAGAEIDRRSLEASTDTYTGYTSHKRGSTWQE